MALLFKLPDGEEWRTGMNNIPVFPVKTPQAFHDQLLASAPDPATGRPDPAKMKAFVASYPETAKAMPLIGNRPISSGFDNSTYNSLNAFRFINTSGAVVPVRWSMVSVQPFEPTSTADPGKTGKNYLFDALIASIHSHPLQWRLVVTVGEPGDPTDAPTIPWPPDRQQVEVGTLTIDHVESEETSPARDINFDPLILPDGIAGSDDPLLSARSTTYSQSFTRREGERNSPARSRSSKLKNEYAKTPHAIRPPVAHSPLDDGRAASGHAVHRSVDGRLVGRLPYARRDPSSTGHHHPDSSGHTASKPDMHDATPIPAHHVPSGTIHGFVIRKVTLRLDVRPAARGLGHVVGGHYPIVMFGSIHLPPILPANPMLYAVLRQLHTILAYLLFATFLAHLSAVLFHR